MGLMLPTVTSSLVAHNSLATLRIEHGTRCPCDFSAEMLWLHLAKSATCQEQLTSHPPHIHDIERGDHCITSEFNVDAWERLDNPPH